MSFDSTDRVRQDQQQFARRMQGGTASSTDSKPGPKKFVAKGHDAQLQEAQFNNIRVLVSLMNADDTINGTITKRDKYTVTVRHLLAGATRDSIIFKHAIESITLLREVV